MRFDKFDAAVRAGTMTRGEAYNARKAERAQNAPINAAKREARKQAAMHCQCCGRAILANKGRIAHHGYQRPGFGWQTSSCMGAKALPFEVARDRLGDMIVIMRRDLARMIDNRASIDAETVAINHSYTVRVKTSRFNTERETKYVEVTRANFDEVRKNRDTVIYDHDFDGFKKSKLARCKSEIKNLTDHVALEQARFDGWKQTHERRDDQWVKL